MALALAKRDIVDLKNPEFLTQQYFNKLQADSEEVNMKKVSPYMYENVLKISNYVTSEQHQSIIPMFQQTFIDRTQNIIIDHSEGSSTEQTNSA
jgi:ABC-type sulfate transport system substrate-binding protein